jgi:hypothetical protein
VARGERVIDCVEQFAADCVVVDCVSESAAERCHGRLGVVVGPVEVAIDDPLDPSAQWVERGCGK